MDVVMTIPKGRWKEWLSEGDLATGSMTPAEWEETNEYGLTFGRGGRLPKIEVGERVYIVAHGRLRGFSPLVGIGRGERFGGRLGSNALIRRGGAVAVTIDEEIRGFQGFRYRWWNRVKEYPFPDWADV